MILFLNIFYLHDTSFSPLAFLFYCSFSLSSARFYCLLFPVIVVSAIYLRSITDLELMNSRQNSALLFLG